VAQFLNSFYGEFEPEQIRFPPERGRATKPASPPPSAGADVKEAAAVGSGGRFALLGVQASGMLSICLLLNVVSVCVCVRIYHMRGRDLLRAVSPTNNGKSMV